MGEVVNTNPNGVDETNSTNQRVCSDIGGTMNGAGNHIFIYIYIYLYMWKGPLCIEWRCLKYRSIIHNYIDTFLHRKNIYKKRIVLVMFLLFVQLSTDVLEIKGAAGFLTKWRWPGKKCHRCEFARINQKKFCTHHHLDAWMRSLRNMLSHMGKSWVLVFLCWKQHQNMYCGPAGYNAFLSA